MSSRLVTRVAQSLRRLSEANAEPGLIRHEVPRHVILRRFRIRGQPTVGWTQRRAIGCLENLETCHVPRLYTVRSSQPIARDILALRGTSEQNLNRSDIIQKVFTMIGHMRSSQLRPYVAPARCLVSIGLPSPRSRLPPLPLCKLTSSVSKPQSHRGRGKLITCGVAVAEPSSKVCSETLPGLGSRYEGMCDLKSARTVTE